MATTATERAAAETAPAAATTRATSWIDKPAHSPVVRSLRLAARAITETTLVEVRTRQNAEVADDP